MKLNLQAFLDSLVFMVEGWLGIFLVMAVIIAVVYALNKLTAEKKDA